MKRWGWIVAVVLCWGLYTCEARAGVKEWAKNSLTYVFSPVNAVANLSVDLWACGTSALARFIATVAGNVSRNPVTLDPLFTLQ